MKIDYFISRHHSHEIDENYIYKINSFLMNIEDKNFLCIFHRLALKRRFWAYRYCYSSKYSQFLKYVKNVL